LALLLASPSVRPLLCATPPPQPSTEVEALVNKARQAYQAHKLPESLSLFNEAVARARALSDKAGEASALHSLGLLYDNRGERQHALEYYNQALALERAVADRAGEAKTL